MVLVRVDAQGYLLGIYHISQLEVLAKGVSLPKPKDGNLAAAPKDKAAFILSAQFFSNPPRIGVNQFSFARYSGGPAAARGPESI